MAQVRINEIRGLSAGRYVPRLQTYFKAYTTPYEKLRFIRAALITQNVIVPDVSFYQDINATLRGIDFDQMRLAGARGVIIRAGQGTWEDEDFKRNWAAAKAAGLPRGAYWLLDPRVDPKFQAEKFAALLAADPPELDVWADYEAPDSWGGAYAGWDGLYNFLERLKAKMPNQKITIYTGYYYWLEHSPPPGTASSLYFKQYKVNIAWYTSNPADVRIPLPWTNEDLLWWQFTDNGNGLLYGAESKNIDLNYCNKTPEEYVKYFGLNGGTQPPNGGGMTTWYTATGNITMRTGPGTTFPNAQIGGVNQYVYTGDVVESSEVQNGFAHLVKLLRNGLEVQLPSVAWAGTAYLTVTTAPVPPTTQNPRANIEFIDSDGKKYSAQDIELKPNA